MNYLSLYPWLSVLPALVSIVLALSTRNVLFSLFSGAFLGSILLCEDFCSLELPIYLIKAFTDSFFANGEVKWPNIALIFFFWILGTLVYLMQHSGYIKSFAGFLVKRLKTSRTGQLFTLFLGLVLFIDDYFKILAIGSIACVFYDQMGISRAKLAYFLDVTAAPVCVLVPISSWGASIIATLNTIITEQHIPGYNGLQLFFSISFYNWYAIFSLMLAFMMTLMRFDFKEMRHKELMASQRKFKGQIVEGTGREVVYFISPVVVLTFITIVAVLATGIIGLEEGKEATLLAIIAAGNTNLAMVLGGLVAIGLAFYLRKQTVALDTAATQGFSTMFPSMTILTFAWALSKVISDVKTGSYLAGLIEEIPYFSVYYLPFFIFFIAGIIAFSSGTSWGTFAIMLPIVAEIAMSNDPELLVPLMAASIGGAIFGDHASPISDTSILSSTGAGCDHMEHISTQLPYAFFVAGITLFGYVVFGLTHSLFTSSLLSFISLLVSTLGYYHVYVYKGK